MKKDQVWRLPTAQKKTCARTGVISQKESADEVEIWVEPRRIEVGI